MDSYIGINDLSILLVEPSVTQRRIISAHLEREEVSEIAFADNVADALTKMRQHEPDLVISALYFSDGTGAQLLEKMKQELSLSTIPFMLISSECRKSHLEQFKQSGAIAILPKPFSAESLGIALNATLDLLNPEELELDYFDINQMRVLVVDDSRLARKHICRVLNNLGISELTEAVNGKEAIEIMQQQIFDLVVTDYNMPEMDGRELTEAIRNSSEQSHIPIMMVSSEANETHLANIVQAGVNALCDKPFEPQHVRQMIYSLMQG